MSAWITFIKERVPLFIYLLLSAGMVTSSLVLLGEGLWSEVHIISVIGLLIFFIELRFMDEFKDVNKDRIAHPERPLPRGLLTEQQVRKAINGLYMVMIIWSLLTTSLFSVMGGLGYMTVTIVLGLMYKEFFVGDWLSKRPILYALSHQLIIYPIVFFPIACLDIEAALSINTFYLGTMMIGGFLAYEVCRKLDPEANPVLETYLSVYGKANTTRIVLACLITAAFGAKALGVHHILWPIEIILALSLIIVFKKPEKYKIIEAIAGISLLAHMWAYTSMMG